MTASKDSPNWHWSRLGYTVTSGPRRKITRQDGSDVFIPESECRHREEVKVALEEFEKNKTRQIV